MRKSHERTKSRSVTVDSKIESLLRAIGLKIVSSVARKLRRPLVSEEPKKCVASKDPWLALTQASVHLLPTIASLTLIWYNAKEHLLGEDFNGWTQFGLQIGAKSHELTIVASLGTIVFESVQRHILSENGLSLGVVGCGFSFSSISFLWSTDFFSAFRPFRQLRNQIWLLLLIFASSILASIVGPASAVLFVPSLTWWNAGGTEFYLRGTADQLWPTSLTYNHTGGDDCLQNTSPEKVWCVNGGYLPLLGHVAAHTSGPKGTWDNYISDREVERAMSIGEPLDTSGLTGTEIWAFVSHAATAWLALDNTQKWNIASNLAEGVPSKYKYMGTISTFANGSVPVVRAVCGPVQDITTQRSLELQFPLLDPDKPWWNYTASLDVQPAWGPLLNFSITDESLMSFSPTQQARARWIVLPSEFTATSAGLVFVSRNSSHTVGRGCTVDSRWAQGWVWTAPSALIKPFYPHIGEDYIVPMADDRPNNFFSRKSLYTSTIQANQVWLDATSPLLSLGANGYQMSTFESLLNTTLLRNPQWVATDSQARRLLEYIMCIHFVDALSRIGWNLQGVAQGSHFLVDPTLEQFINDNTTGPNSWVSQIMSGGKIYKRPDPSVTPTTISRYYQYRQGWVWTLKGSGTGGKFAIACLAIHMGLAMTHTILILRTGQASKSWGSIPEALALAYNSSPRGGGIKNCGGGIRCMGTLNRVVRVGIINGESNEKVQLAVLESSESGRRGGEKLGMTRPVVGHLYE